jgi:transposase-like protein
LSAVYAGAAYCEAASGGCAGWPRRATAVEACRQVGIAEQTLYRWRKEYGGLKVDQARRMKDLERENVRLKKLMADLALDKAILQEASKLSF